jgi:hypothetical protein
MLEYFHTVKAVNPAPEEPQEITQEVTSSQEVTQEQSEDISEVSDEQVAEEVTQDSQEQPVHTVDVFTQEILPQIKPVQTAIQIGCEYNLLRKKYSQCSQLNEQSYCKAKRITQPYLMKCIRKFESQ